MVVVVLWLGASPFILRDISPHFWPNGMIPTSLEYAQLKASGRKNYELRIDGLVDTPTTLTYADLLAYDLNGEDRREKLVG